MAYFFSRLKQYQLPIISGILIGTSFPPFPSWAVTFCWVPLWFFSFQQSDSKKVFWGAWWTQFTLTLIGFHWIAYTANAFGGLPWIISILALLAYAALVHLHIPLVMWGAHKLRHGKNWPPHWNFFTFAIGITLIERIWPMIFPWNLGYSLLFSRLEVYNLSEFIGFFGLSAVLLLVNAFMAWGLWEWRRHKVRAAALLCSAAFFFFFLNIAGSLLRHQSHTHESQKSLKVLMVQANIGQPEKILAEKHLNSGQHDIAKLVLQKYFDLTDAALKEYPETQVIVWPETAVPDYLDAEDLSRPRAIELRTKILQWNRALITGAYSKSRPQNFANDKAADVYNGLFFFNPKGDLSSPAYRKSLLLAFGERLPFGDIFPGLYKLLPFVSSFAQGPGPQVRTLQYRESQTESPMTAYSEILVGPQICYEGLFPTFSRDLAQQGANLFVNVTNDSWFGRHFEPFQHATMTWARAIEFRTPLVRATNTGQSSIITHKGKVLIRSPLDQDWYGFADIPLPDKRSTFYEKYGHLDWVILLMLLFTLIWRAHRHAKRNRES